MLPKGIISFNTKKTIANHSKKGKILKGIKVK